MGSRAAKDHQLDLHRRQHGRSSDRPIATRHPYLEEERMSRSRSRRVNHASDCSLLETGRSGNGIVEDWLANVSRRGVDTRGSAKRLQSNQDKSNAKNPEWRPHGISLQNAVQGGHKRAPSRDSSIIPEPVTKKARPSIAVISHGPFHRSPVTGVTDFPISADSSPPRFEKRARYKTREDRYDSRKKPKEKRRRAPEETIRRSEEVPKKPILSGRDVMNNFQPEAVLNDRLTLQPCLTPGLFQNGQISSPKPVGDLAYNSMISVEHPPSREYSWQRQQRSEAKARQRREIELVEISTFLRRKETPTTEHPVAGRGRPRDSYEDQKLKDRLPENLPACDDRLSTRSITGSDSLRDDQRCHIHDKTYVAPVRQVRSSSRATTYVTWATSGKHQTSLPGNSFDRHHSSTPEPFREALRETGIFDGAEINRKARVSSHDLRRRKQEVHPDGESKNFEASREQPMIIRYLDKGVMTTNESSPSPSVLEQSRSLSAARDSFVLENTADTRAEVLVGSTAEQALNEPSGGEIHKDSNGESCRKAAAPTTRASTAMQAYLLPPSIDLSAKTQAIPKNKIQEAETTTPNIAKATMPVAERSDVCVKGDVELGREATVNQSNEQFLAPELSAMPPVPCWQQIRAPAALSGREEPNHSALPEEELLDNNSYDHLTYEIDHSGETFWPPQVFSRTTSRVNQPRKPYHYSRPRTNGPGSMTRFNPSQFQRSESIIDFIARVEQEVLGPESSGYVDNPSDEARVWQHDDRLGAPSDTFREAQSLIPRGVSTNQPLAEPGRRHPEDAFDRMEEEPSEIRYHGERTDESNQYWAEQHTKQPEDEKYDKDEKEEMLAFWRPNYFH